MSDNIIVAVISSFVAPVLLIIVQETVRYIRNKKKNILQDIEDGIIELKRDNLRLQILNLIQHDPKNRIAINNLYDKYKEMKGNSYISEIYKKWARTL